MKDPIEMYLMQYNNQFKNLIKFAIWRPFFDSAPQWGFEKVAAKGLNTFSPRMKNFEGVELDPIWVGPPATYIWRGSVFPFIFARNHNNFFYLPARKACL
jgi:hypothetical protein